MGEDWEIKKKEHEDKVRRINELSELKHQCKDFVAVNHLEGCLIKASFLMRIHGKHAEAERLLDKALLDFEVTHNRLWL